MPEAIMQTDGAQAVREAVNSASVPLSYAKEMAQLLLEHSSESEPNRVEALAAGIASFIDQASAVLEKLHQQART